MHARACLSRSCRAFPKPHGLYHPPKWPRVSGLLAARLPLRTIHSRATESTATSSQDSQRLPLVKSRARPRPRPKPADSEPSVSSTATARAGTATLITTTAELATVLDEISQAPSLYIDLEGHWLSRVGSLDILSISSHPHGKVYLIDIYTLQQTAFSTLSAASTPTSPTTLKTILEKTHQPKYLWDVRNDADALFSLYGIHLAGVTDLQLLELASRRPHPQHGVRNKFIRSLASSIEYDLALTPEQLGQWAGTKDSVKALMMPRERDSAASTGSGSGRVKQEKIVVELAGNVLTGVVPKLLLRAARAKQQQQQQQQQQTIENLGDSAPPLAESTAKGNNNTGPVTEKQQPLSPPPPSPPRKQRTRHQTSIPPGGPNLSESVFRIRPMTPEIIAYCANDVVHLPALHAEFLSRLSKASPWHDKVRVESDRRIVEAHAEGYSPVGPAKTLSPWRRNRSDST